MFVKARPFSNKASCPQGTYFSCEKLAGEIKRRQLPLKLDMKMWRLVIIEKHSNDNAKE